ncbi:MAG: OsmC family protein, partial [Gluconobacter sp.]
IVVTAYEDQATGEMKEERTGAGQFTSVTLHPRVTLSTTSDAEKALDLHHKAHDMCFIARSVNFPVMNEPVIVHEGKQDA